MKTWDQKWIEALPLELLRTYIQHFRTYPPKEGTIAVSRCRRLQAELARREREENARKDLGVTR